MALKPCWKSVLKRTRTHNITIIITKASYSEVFFTLARRKWPKRKHNMRNLSDTFPIIWYYKSNERRLHHLFHYRIYSINRLSTTTWIQTCYANGQGRYYTIQNNFYNRKLKISDFVFDWLSVYWHWLSERRKCYIGKNNEIRTGNGLLKYSRELWKVYTACYIRGRSLKIIWVKIQIEMYKGLWKNQAYHQIIDNSVTITTVCLTSTLTVFRCHQTKQKNSVLFVTKGNKTP